MAIDFTNRTTIHNSLLYAYAHPNQENPTPTPPSPVPLPVVLSPSEIAAARAAMLAFTTHSLFVPPSP